MGAALILGVATVAAPLFLSSAGTAAVQRGIEESGATVPAFTVTDYSAIEHDLIAYRDRALVGSVLAGGGLGQPVRSIVGTQVALGLAGSPASEVLPPLIPLARAGVTNHVKIVEGSGDGMIIPASVAKLTGLKPGDRATVRSGDSAATVPVSGVYQDLSDQPRTPYWAPLAGLIYAPPLPLDAPPPPPFLILSEDQFVTLANQLGGQGQFRWEFPLASGRLTLLQAQALADRTERLEGFLGDPATQLGSAFAGASVDSPVGQWVIQATQTVGAISGPVEALALAGRVVAMVVVAAAGVYAVNRRRVEFGLLYARGLSPVRLGVRTAVESVLPVAAGIALGAAAGAALVRALGPSDLVTDQAVRQAVTYAAWTAAVSIVLLGAAAVVAVRSLAEMRTGRLRQAASRAPWEIAVLALAAASFYEIVTRGGGPVEAAGGPPRVDRLLLLFPILFVAGTAGLAARGLRRLLPRLRTAGGRTPPSRYLALRRLANAPRMALLLVTASALAVGMLTYGGVLSSSIQHTADAKAHLSVGSDVAATVGGPATPLKEVGFPTTPITIVNDVSVGTNRPADLMGIDPPSYEATAYWDGGIMGASLPDLMAKLRSTPSDRLPVIVGGGGSVEERSVLRLTGVSIPIQVVGRAKALPGMRRDRPLILADLQALYRAATANQTQVLGTYQLWAKGDPATIMAAFEAQRVPTDLVATAAVVEATPAFTALSWTFGFLEALGIMAGLLALIGVVLYLQARQRTREVSYALARRMGLSPGAHRLSVALELMGMLLSAFVIGGVLAVGGAALVFGKLDPLPAIPPAPLFDLPWGLFGLTAAALVAVSFAGAWAVQRRADHANVAEVMRLAA